MDCMFSRREIHIVILFSDVHMELVYPYKDIFQFLRNDINRRGIPLLALAGVVIYLNPLQSVFPSLEINVETSL